MVFDVMWRVCTLYLFFIFFFFLSLDCLAGNEVGDNLKKIIIYDAKQRGDFVQQPANNGRVNIRKCPPTQDPLQVLFQARINASTRPIYLHDHIIQDYFLSFFLSLQYIMQDYAHTHTWSWSWSWSCPSSCMDYAGYGKLKKKNDDLLIKWG